ncbi:MAG: lipocalin family protein [Acidobacteriota bacterium]
MFIRSRSGYLFFLVLMSLVIYSGCKKDSNNPASPAVSSSPIVGKWLLSNVTVTNKDGSKTSYTPQQLGLSITMEFRNDLTATITTADSSGTTTESGTYTYSSGVLNLTNTSGEKRTVDITMNGNKFTTKETLTDTNGNPIDALLEFTKQ